MRTWVLMWTIFIAVSAFGQDKPVSVKTVEIVKRAAIPIVCGAPQQDGSFRVSKIMGSAFFINDEGYFLTAGHIFDAWTQIDRSKGDCFPAVYIPIGGWHSDRPIDKVRWFKFQTCLKGNSIDVAACKLDVNPFTSEDVKKQIQVLTFGRFFSLEDGTPVAFTGFPLELLRPVTSKGNIASFGEIEKLIVIDTGSWPGASGSPLYSAEGSVIGVMVKTGINLGTGLAYALPAETVIAFLRENKIKFQQKK